MNGLSFLRLPVGSMNVPRMSALLLLNSFGYICKKLKFLFEISAYIFPCLDGCQCDTNDEAIHCHSGKRISISMPESRLRGFSIIGITNNNIQKLPPESELLEKFPDLRAIDVEGNNNLDCDSVKSFEIIKVYSHCEGSQSATVIRGHRLPDIEMPTDVCFICFAAENISKFGNMCLEKE
ncbi:unnamed protein product [Dracunculus medinensis]|uniref:LRRNT domain-containing protein n=1 Tax=Dracunculus medinensis TaxID=318479 RepID=A0A0N4U6Y4_DRAME|nr:unnamed protein product [Dracunculus medinensis]